MFSYYGSECFSNKSLCKQVSTLKKKKKQGSSNAQQKYILKCRRRHRKGGSVHTVTCLGRPGLQESGRCGPGLPVSSLVVLFLVTMAGLTNTLELRRNRTQTKTASGVMAGSQGASTQTDKRKDQTPNTHHTEDVTSVKNNLWSVGIPQRRACTGFFSFKRYLWLQFKHTATYNSTRGT